MTTQPAIRRADRRRPSRRGITILLVLMLISMTLATCYALMRSQITAVQIGSNSNRALAARQAAMAGMSAAMRKMHEGTWGGVGSTLSGSLTSTERYEAAYTAGDSALTSASTDYADLPYRVTINAKGFSTDPTNAQLTATATVQAVMRLIPRALGTPPSNWPSIRQYTYYQTGDGFFSVDVPCRIEGPVRAQAIMRLSQLYSWGASTRQRYLGDLNAMRLSGTPDYRPLTGPIYAPLAQTDSTTKSLMTNQLGLSLVDIPVTTTPDMMLPEQLASYRLYPGGPSYSVGALPSNLTNTTLVPDPLTNPLGIYFRGSGGSIGSGVTVTGTLIYNGDLAITGSNVHFAAPNLPPLYGSSETVRLPATVVRQKCSFGTDVDAVIDGSMLMGREFDVERGHEDARLAVNGRVVASGLSIRRRDQWNHISVVWDVLYTLFTNQLADTNPPPIPYFPVYLREKFGHDPNPRLTVKPAVTPALDHWQNLGNPIFVAHPSDGGLRWELVRWTAAP